MSPTQITGTDDFYTSARDAMFTTTDWSPIRAAATALPKARFVIGRNFDFKAPFVAYYFFTDLVGRFGATVAPISLSEACIDLTLAFSRITSWDGRDFRALMLGAPDFHELFRDHAVSMIDLKDFPEAVDKSTGMRYHNVTQSRFLIEASGRPVPGRLISSPPTPR